MAADTLLVPLANAANMAYTVFTLAAATSFALAVLALFFSLALIFWVWLKYRLFLTRREDSPLVVGLFHPYCNAGGGGERVLWVALKAMAARFPDAKFLVYTGDVDAAPDQIAATALARFGVNLGGPELKPRLEFVYLHRRQWLEAARYPVFTLLRQSWGSFYVGKESHYGPSIVTSLSISFGSSISRLSPLVRGHYGLRRHAARLQVPGRLLRCCLCALPHDQHGHAQSRPAWPRQLQQQEGHRQKPRPVLGKSALLQGSLAKVK